MREGFFNIFPSTLYQGSCFKMRRTFSFNYELIPKNNRVYFNGPRKDVQPEYLYSEGNKFSKKLVVSAVITWKGVGQNFFIGGNGIKVNGATYLKHLRDDLIPAAEAMHLNKDFTFVQDSAPSHRAKTSWSRSWSPDLLRTLIGLQNCSPLDYYFWDPVQQKIYFFSFASIDLKFGMLTKIWFQSTLSKFCNISITLRQKIDF